MKEPIFDLDFWMKRGYERFQATDEYIRQNQEENRRQRERERAYRNSNSAPPDAQNTENKDKDTA